VTSRTNLCPSYMAVLASWPSPACTCTHAMKRLGNMRAGRHPAHGLMLPGPVINFMLTSLSLLTGREFPVPFHSIFTCFRPPRNPLSLCHRHREAVNGSSAGSGGFLVLGMDGSGARSRPHDLLEFALPRACSASKYRPQHLAAYTHGMTRIRRDLTAPLYP
jgi:hypothetical protein